MKSASLTEEGRGVGRGEDEESPSSSKSARSFIASSQICSFCSGLEGGGIKSEPGGESPRVIVSGLGREKGSLGGSGRGEDCWEGD